jgi:hypothetical protein
MRLPKITPEQAARAIAEFRAEHQLPDSMTDQAVIETACRVAVQKSIEANGLDATIEELEEIGEELKEMASRERKP